MGRKSKKKKFKENIFKEEEIKYYLTKVRKFAISEDDKSLIKSLQIKKKNKIPKFQSSKQSHDEELLSKELQEEELQEEELLEEELLEEEKLSSEQSLKDEELPSEQLLKDDLSSEKLSETSNTLNINLLHDHPYDHLDDHLVENLLHDHLDTHLVDHLEKKFRLEPEYKNVMVERDIEVDLKRRKLPCCMMEQEIIDTIKNNDIILITGDTGTGKSTQIPQFLYENGFCIDDLIIGITQTRRVACIAITKQISLELNTNQLIGYQIRYDKKYNENCKIKFMTDGILINELKNDILLHKYSVIIIDEAHERRINSDILIGLLTQIVKLRRKQYNNYLTKFPLKMIIMSATIRKEDFLGNELFKGIKHVHITSDSLNYTVHYNKTTPKNYLLEAKKKILQIHKKLPKGSILVFLTGKYELYKLKMELSKSTEFSSSMELSSSIESSYPVESSYPIESSDTVELSSDTNTNTNETNINEDIFELNDELTDDMREGDDMRGEFTGDDELRGDYDLAGSMSRDYDLTGSLSRDDDMREDMEEERIEYELKVLSENYKKSIDCEWLGSDSQGKLTIKILHASQSNQQQMNCFMLPNDNERIVILSTNVAETSITLPNIRYVIDCGKEKRKIYDNLKGYEKFQIVNISKSSADQRAGRCGRLGHGHCYRLYTNTVFENLFPETSPIEILQTNLTSVILLLISFGIDPYKFTFLTRPSKILIDSAINTLYNLNIIKYNRVYEEINLLTDPFKVSPNNYKLDSEIMITKLGKCINLLPMDPRYSKMIFCILSKLNHIKENNKANFLSLSFIIISTLSFNNSLFIFTDRSYGVEGNNRSYGVEGTKGREGINSNEWSKGNKGIKGTEGIKDNNTSDEWINKKYNNDIELIMYIICEYSKNEEKNEFCRKFSINEKLLQEIFLQTNQIFQILSNHFNTPNPSIESTTLSQATDSTTLGQATEFSAPSEPTQISTPRPLIQSKTPIPSIESITTTTTPIESTTTTTPIESNTTQQEIFGNLNKYNKINNIMYKLKGNELRILLESIIECLIDKVAINNKYLSGNYGYKCSQMGNEIIYLNNKFSKLNYKCVVYNYLMSVTGSSITVLGPTESGVTESEVKETVTGTVTGTEVKHTNMTESHIKESHMNTVRIKMYNIVQVDLEYLGRINSNLIIGKDIEKYPRPYYKNGIVMAYVKQYYGPLDYPLTILKVQLNKHPLVFRAFAEAFCFGKIYPKLQQFVPLLKYTNEDFFKPLKFGLYNFIKLIVKKNIYNKITFEKEYTKNNQFLFNEYIKLLHGYNFNKLLTIYKSLQ